VRTGHRRERMELSCPVVKPDTEESDKDNPG